MKNKMLKKGLAIGMSAFLLASSLAPVSVQAASWKQNKTGWWWQEDNGSYPVSQWKVINGKWYAFDERGYMRSGWFLSNGKWYYLGDANDGSMKTGWQLINGSWYYLNPVNGDMAANQWIGIYYVNGSGVWDQGKTKDLIGWIQSGNRWWYRHADGSYTRNDWELINGSWYYFDNAGWMLANQWIGNYYVDGSGKWIPGKTKATAQWIQSGNRWWYRHADGGYTRNGWELINGSWYYFDNAGWMLSNQWIGNYYVGGSGAMLTDTWIGNYYVDASGKWVPDAKKDQHTHKWVAETTVINHPAEGHMEKVLVSPEEGHTVTVVMVPEEFHMETVHHPEESHMETVHHDAVTHTIHHEAEGEYKTVHHDAVTHTEVHFLCNTCGADMGTTQDSIRAHLDWHADRGEAAAYAEKSVTVVDKAAYDEQVWVETKAAWDETIVDKEAWDEQVKVVDKEAWDEQVKVVDKEAITREVYVKDKDAVYEDCWYIDKDAWTETVTKNVCSECGAVQ